MSKQERIHQLQTKETLLNVAKHIPGYAILPTLVYEPLVQGINPVDFLTDGPIGFFQTIAGLGVAFAGTVMKSANDATDLQTICENTQKEPEEQTLVTSGQYESIRHPTYVAQALMTGGLYMMNPTLIGTTLMCTYLGLTSWLARVEEEKNTLQFGNAYTEYMAKTPRWIPRNIRAIRRNTNEHLMTD